MGLLTMCLHFIIRMFQNEKYVYVSTCISYLFMICARFFLLKFYVLTAFWTTVCAFNGNCLKNYRTTGDFYSDFWQSLKSQYKWEKKSFFWEIKSATLFIITLTEIWEIFTEKRNQNVRKKVLRKRFKTLSTSLEVASLLTLAILFQNWDVVKSETSFRISTTLNWTFSQHAD